MSDALSDLNEYWNRRCEDCKRKYSEIYNKCIEGRDIPDTYNCEMIGKKHDLIS